MPILNIITQLAGTVDVKPSLAYIQTNDPKSSVIRTGYLNQSVQAGITFTMPCLACVSTAASPTLSQTSDWYQVIKSGLNWSLVPLVAPSGSGFNEINVQIFTSGSYTYTPTSGIQYAIVEMTGAGGGSGGLACSVAQSGAIGGGGGGGYMRLLGTATNIGASCSGTIGAAGAAGTAGNNDGGSGGNTTFIINGSTWTAGGGAGSAGASTSATAMVSHGGISGTNIPGSNAMLISSEDGGDGSDGWSIGGASGITSGGSGGGTFWGPGGSSFVYNSTSQNANGGAPSYGSGSGGCISVNTGTNLAGLAGNTGYIVITEFITT